MPTIRLVMPSCLPWQSVNWLGRYRALSPPSLDSKSVADTATLRLSVLLMRRLTCLTCAIAHTCIMPSTLQTLRFFKLPHIGQASQPFLTIHRVCRTLETFPFCDKVGR